MSWRLLLATHNAHKRREFGRLLPGVEIVTLTAAVSLPPEDGETFGENALGKARAAARATGMAAIADDSGIAAAALDGAPGVRSARYAGEQASDEENLAKLIREVPVGSALEYVCMLAYAAAHSADGQMRERLFEGRCGGRMAPAPRGQGGFGYDPVFLPEEGPPGLTMAQLSDAQKDAVSHRGNAARSLLAWLGLCSLGPGSADRV